MNFYKVILKVNSNIILIFLLILFSINVKAQQYYNSTLVNGILNKHIVHKNNNSILVFNSRNKLTNVGSKSTLSAYDPEMVDTKLDIKALQNIFGQEISPEILRLLTLERRNYVNVLIDFDKNGNVIEVAFGTQLNSPIMPLVFEKIEDRIKKEITASYSQVKLKTINAPAYTTLNFIRYSKTIYFSDLY